jgi:hypothetical protein
MDWIACNWQSLAAGIIVAATAAVFAVRLLRRRKNGGKPPCGLNCECPRKKM